MGFASGAQQLPNNLELKNYNNTDEVRVRAFREAERKKKPKKNNNARNEPLQFYCSATDARPAPRETGDVCCVSAHCWDNRRVYHHVFAATLHPITPGVIYTTQEPGNYLLSAVPMFFFFIIINVDCKRKGLKMV